LILSCCKMNCEWDNVKNRPQTAEVGFFENRTAETEFSVFEFWGRFVSVLRHKSRAVARNPRDAAAVLFSLKFADNIHYQFKSSQVYCLVRIVYSCLFISAFVRCGLLIVTVIKHNISGMRWATAQHPSSWPRRTYSYWISQWSYNFAWSVVSTLLSPA